MASHLDDRLDRVQRKPLAMRGESLRKSVAEDDLKRAVGRVTGRALDQGGLLAIDAARETGYGDNQSPISRWISGEEVPVLLARLFSLRAFRRGLLMALAETESAAGEVEVKTVITVPKRKTEVA